jgi:hypothetical protein
MYIVNGRDHNFEPKSLIIIIISTSLKAELMISQLAAKKVTTAGAGLPDTYTLTLSQARYEIIHKNVSITESDQLLKARVKLK